ncbi:MAG: hypothetical protein LBT15_05725 [Synergistaceae bacterium]|jgi:hypothetical protein|nr:hypothetical protein [Synergistaceae bacterium]
MREASIVTGPMRSGTSCVTGLLELCGFDLGRNIRVLRNPTPMNPRGHFEHDLLFAINERLLVEAGPCGGLFTPPPREELAALAANRQKYFRIFLKEFDGELCKDPLFCLTLAAWLDVWPELRRAVFCLRNPAEVAVSMRKRYGTDFHEGLRVWREYSLRFIENSNRINVFIFDYNRFCREPLDTFSELLNWFGRPVDLEILRGHIASFWSAPTSTPSPDSDGDALPDDIQKLYLDLLEVKSLKLK